MTRIVKNLIKNYKERRRKWDCDLYTVCLCYLLLMVTSLHNCPQNLYFHLEIIRNNLLELQRYWQVFSKNDNFLIFKIISAFPQSSRLLHKVSWKPQRGVYVHQERRIQRKNPMDAQPHPFLTYPLRTSVPPQESPGPPRSVAASLWMSWGASQVTEKSCAQLYTFHFHFNHRGPTVCEGPADIE